MKKIITLFICVLIVVGCDSQALFPAHAQAPKPYSVFNDVVQRYDGDHVTGSAGAYRFIDLSGNGNDMIQQAGTLTPATGVNGHGKVTGNSSAYLNSSYSINNFPITIITVALRANNAMIGFYGHQGASGFGTLWYGYEASNANIIYNTSASQNTTSEAGVLAVYTAKLGYGSRQTWLNGILQTVHTESSVVQSSAATTIGTQYRGLNGDWYETLVWNRDLSLDDMDEVNAYLNTKYSLSIPLWSSYTDQPIIFIWGQSNAAGRGNPKSYLQTNFPAYYSAQTGVNIWCNPADYTSGTGTSWATLDESAFNNDLGDGFGNVDFGFESSIGTSYINRVSGSLYIFKYTQGGTWLARQASSNYWSPSSVDAPNNGHSLYSSWMQNWTDALIALQTAHLNPKGIAIVGAQGEQDATDATASSAYQTNIITFYNALRPEIGVDRKGIKTSIINMRLPNGQSGETYLSTVQTAQDNAASSLVNYRSYNTNSYTFQIDNVHYSNASFVQIGIDLAALF